MARELSPTERFLEEFRIRQAGGQRAAAEQADAARRIFYGDGTAPADGGRPPSPTERFLAWHRATRGTAGQPHPSGWTFDSEGRGTPPAEPPLAPIMSPEREAVWRALRPRP